MRKYVADSSASVKKSVSSTRIVNCRRCPLINSFFEPAPVTPLPRPLGIDGAVARLAIDGA
jgi:hypothetical protein